MELSERHIMQLEKEGFDTVYEVFDEPNVCYATHAHPEAHKIIVTEGSMDIQMDGKVHSVKTGDAITIPKNQIHEVRIGPEGCKYVIGE